MVGLVAYVRDRYRVRSCRELSVGYPDEIVTVRHIRIYVRLTKLMDADGPNRMAKSNILDDVTITD